MNKTQFALFATFLSFVGNAATPVHGTKKCSAANSSLCVDASGKNAYGSTEIGYQSALNDFPLPLVSNKTASKKGNQFVVHFSKEELSTGNANAKVGDKIYFGTFSSTDDQWIGAQGNVIKVNPDGSLEVSYSEGSNLVTEKAWWGACKDCGKPAAYVGKSMDNTGYLSSKMSQHDDNKKVFSVDYSKDELKTSDGKHCTPQVGGKVAFGTYRSMSDAWSAMEGKITKIGANGALEVQYQNGSNMVSRQAIIKCQ